jgi:hypothetical protein
VAEDGMLMNCMASMHTYQMYQEKIGCLVGLCPDVWLVNNILQTDLSRVTTYFGSRGLWITWMNEHTHYYRIYYQDLKIYKNYIYMDIPVNI